MGHKAAEIHSNRSLAQRRDALDGFKSGKYRVLIATDIAARGIDVTGIELVVNFDLPMQAEDYVHRIGRTARAGRTGRAVSFAMFEERQDVRSIERLIRTSLSVKPLPSLPPARHEPHADINQRPGDNGRGRQYAPRRRVPPHRSRLGYAPRRFR
jgi:ATP-dependent RNA helicase RhlE